MSNTTQPLNDGPDLGISREDRGTVIDLLANVLSNQHVLYIKTRNFHWNLKGSRFNSLHVFFEEQYTAIETAIDETAERIRMIGGVSPGSMKEFLEHASLEETKGELLDGDDAIQSLAHDHEQVVRELREAIPTAEKAEDIGTEDFLTGLLQTHEKYAWMLRSFLE